MGPCLLGVSFSRHWWPVASGQNHGEDGPQAERLPSWAALGGSSQQGGALSPECPVSRVPGPLSAVSGSLLWKRFREAWRAVPCPAGPHHAEPGFSGNQSSPAAGQAPLFLSTKGGSPHPHPFLFIFP